MTTVILVLLAAFALAVVALYIYDRDLRRHSHIPKASTYIPPSNCRIKEKP